MTIGKKLGTCVGASFVLASVLGTSATYYLASLRSEIDNTVHKEYHKAGLVNDIRMGILTMRFAERGIILFSAAHGQAKVELNKQMFTTATSTLLAKVEQLRPLLATDQGRALADDIASAVNDYVRIQSAVPKLCAENKLQEAMQIDMEQLVPIGSRATKTSEDLLKTQDALTLTAADRANSVVARASALVTSILVLFVAVSIMAALVARRGSRGLRSIAGRLLESSAKVHSAAGLISNASESLAHGATEQGASLQETSASSEEITSMTGKNADNTRTAATLMSGTSEVVAGANQAIDQMESSMREINASSDKIGRIIKVIDEIAFQTNILALNAAVEAARAGEAGMGFAVVADEVRNLAQRSAQAAKDTAAMIEESIAKSKEGREKLDIVSKSIHDITASAEQVKTLVDEVKVGSEEQARGIAAISQAIAQMQQVTQNSAAHAEETASAGKEMNAEADLLKNVVIELQQMVGSH